MRRAALVLLILGSGCAAPRPLAVHFAEPSRAVDWGVDALKIRGTVADSAGQASPGIEVLLMACGPPSMGCNDHGTAWANADSAGRFAFTVPNPGRYAVVVLSDRLPWVAYQEFRLPEDSARVVQLRVPINLARRR